MNNLLQVTKFGQADETPVEGIRGGKGRGGDLQVNHAKGFGRAYTTMCRYQSILTYKYRKIRKIVYSLIPIKLRRGWPLSIGKIPRDGPRRDFDYWPLKMGCPSNTWPLNKGLAIYSFKDLYVGLI